MRISHDIDFRSIRAHNGSKHRAWEELAYFLAPDLEKLPEDTRLTRRGTPDGGVEFSCPAPPGHRAGIWAWQAKYLFDFQSKTFQQMKSSFEDAMTNNPQLTRYIFVLPEDRPDGANGESAMKKWTRLTEQWAQTAAESGADVEFEFHGHSDVLAALLNSKHAGAAKYFFDTTILSPESMSDQVSKAIADLGQRYDPDLNVKTDFSSLVSGLCLDSRFKNRVDRLLSEAEALAVDAERTIKLYGQSGFPPTPVDHHGAEGPKDSQAQSMERLPVRPGLIESIDGWTLCEFLPELNAAVADCRKALDHHHSSRLESTRQTLSKGLDAVIADRRKLEELISKRCTDQHLEGESGRTNIGTTVADASRDRAPTSSQVLKALSLASSALSNAVRFLESRTASAALQPAVSLVGPAGCGKSHSIADVARERLAAGAPTVLVLGQQLSKSTLLGEEIGRFLQFDASWSEILGALQVAAQVTGQGRALIAIDAINEGPGANLWKERLGGLLKEIGSYPLVAILISVRDTYESALIVDSIQHMLIRAEHHGLAGHESEAIQLYANHYGLQVSNVPLLHPEFSNPLLLRSVCRSSKHNGLTRFPTAAVSQHWVFDGLLNAVNTTASATLDRETYDQIVHRAVRRLSECMLNSDTEAISYDDARSACRTVHDDQGRASGSLVAVLEREGILLREQVTDPTTKPTDSQTSEQVRFTYQRMSDHLRAQALLAQNENDNDLVQAVAGLLADRSWRAAGLIESLSALIPDSRGRELIDLVSDQNWFDSSRQLLADALIGSLTWRASSTINARTITLVRDHVRTGHIEHNTWLSTLLSLACVPDHPLNVDYLHPLLENCTLIERDTKWSQQVTWIWLDDDNPLARTIDWLWGRCHRLEVGGARLVCRLMAWLLSCTSRRLRDSATKLLVEVVDRYPETLPQLLQDFATVNDPYIRERLMAVSLGHVTRMPSSPLTSSGAERLAETHEAAIQMAAAPGHPPHALVTHYANQLTYETHRRLPEVGLTSHVEARAAWPLSPPTKVELRNQLGDSSNRYLQSSPIKYDFREYNLDRGICSDFIPPAQSDLRRRRKTNARARYRRAIRMMASKTGHTALEIDQILSAPEPRMTLETLRSLRDNPGFRGELTSAPKQLQIEQPELFARAKSAQREHMSNEPVRLPTELLERQIIARTLDLGWRPASQGGPDAHPINDSWAGWGQDKIERIGKKYSWIAFYEAIATLGQNCTVRDWNQSEKAYNSIWQLPYVCDIDPTITLRGDSPGIESASARLVARTRTADHASAWWLDGFRSPLKQAIEPDDQWLRTTSDLPDPRGLLTVSDPSGDEWIVLESHIEWQKDTPGAAHESRPHRRDMWVRSHSYLTPRDGVGDIRSWSREKNWMGLWMPTPPNGGLGYYQQYPYGEPWTAWIAETFKDHSNLDAPTETSSPHRPEGYAAADGWTRPTRRDFPGHPIALTTLGSTANADVDMSARDLPRGLFPSPLLLRLLRAEQTPIYGAAEGDCERLNLGAVERAYSWSNSNRVVMFGTDGVEKNSPMALFVHARTLETALAAHELTWWTWILGEKISWRYGNPTGDRMEMFGAAGLREGHLEEWNFDTCFYGQDDQRN